VNVEKGVAALFGDRRGEHSVGTETILGVIGTATGVISLVWHIVRSRHDRCEFRPDGKVKYFAVPLGWTRNPVGRAVATAARSTRRALTP